MPRIKREIIQKKVTLIKFEREELIVKEYDECYILHGNNSLTIDGWNYCKGEDYYFCHTYLFLINHDKKDEAIQGFCNLISDYKLEIINRVQSQLENLTLIHYNFVRRYC